MKIVVIYNGKRKNDEVLTVKSVKEFCNEPFYFWDILQKKQRLLEKKQLFFWMIGCKQRAAGERKVFWSSNFSKMLARCGRAAHICEANWFCSLFFLLQLQFLKLPNSELAALMKQVTNSNKATGQLQHAGRQKQGWNPLLPDAKELFSLRAILALFHVKQCF